MSVLDLQYVAKQRVPGHRSKETLFSILVSSDVLLACSSGDTQFSRDILSTLSEINDGSVRFVGGLGWLLHFLRLILV